MGMGDNKKLRDFIILIWGRTERQGRSRVWCLVKRDDLRGRIKTDVIDWIWSKKNNKGKQEVTERDSHFLMSWILNFLWARFDRRENFPLSMAYGSLWHKSSEESIIRKCRQRMYGCNL